MIWVLILSMFIDEGGVSITTQEFVGLKACNTAGRIAQKQHQIDRGAYRDVRVNWSCVPKRMPE